MPSRSGHFFIYHSCSDISPPNIRSDNVSSIESQLAFSLISVSSTQGREELAEMEHKHQHVVIEPPATKAEGRKKRPRLHTHVVFLQHAT